jgi:phosphoadenosine phosphosulfate reductase
MQVKIAELNQRFHQASPEEILSWIVTDFPGKVTFSTSFGAEDQVITHMLAGMPDKLKMFTLDTGRMFQETYELLEITRKKYGIVIDVYFPDTAHVEDMVRTRGINLFYDSIENRQMCCHIRKIEPLKRALAGMDVWITGMRKEQSVTRARVDLFEWDQSNGIVKVNPLIDWTNEMVWNYIQTQRIPFNELHSKGYPSIGCLPCTRPIQPGEDLRSGRWWWELPEFKECGLHKKP